MLDDPPMLKGWEWVKKGLTADDGSLDDARLNAALLVASYIALQMMSVIMSADHAFHAQDFGIGAGALAAGIGGWFKMRGGN